jgi:endonuclease YncB( thermonuclease family)
VLLTSLHKKLTKKALRKGAFFAFITFVLNIIVLISFANAESCVSHLLSMPERATVKWVYDGDSLLLKDKRKIRIIGIDTPEIKHHKQKAQAYGAKAREALRVLLKNHNYQVLLRYGQERRDKYNRILAHVYLPNGINISNWMLEQGYAKTLAFPPNIQLAKCYKRAEEVAQAQSLKIWRYKSHKIRSAASLPRRISGYVRLKGKISKIKHYKKSLVIELQSNSKTHINLKIKKKNLKYFTEIAPDKLWNKTIIVTGILKNKKGRRTLYVSHPTQIKQASDRLIFDNLLKPKKEQAPKASSNIKWSLQK